VLAHVGPHLVDLGFVVETGKKKAEKVHVPVLYGNNGKIAKALKRMRIMWQDGSWSKWKLAAA